MAFSPERSERAVSWGWTLFILAGMAVVATLLFPSPGPGNHRTAARTQAKNDATQIATAISAYVTEYGRLPISSDVDVTVSEETQSYLMDVLSPPGNPPFPGGNIRGIVFLEVPKAPKGHNGRIDGKGPYLDPWGHPYFITLDSNYDGLVRLPGGDVSAPLFRKSVIVWSRGDPKKNGYDKPEKWVKSWE